MEGLRIYYYSMVCPLVSLLIRIMIQSFASYYFVQSSLVYKYLELHTHTAQSTWCYLVGNVHIGSMLDQLDPDGGISQCTLHEDNYHN